IEVIMTRDDDVNLGLAARAHVARENEADLFISIHYNGWEDASVDGTVTFTGRGASERSQQFASRLQSAVVAVTGVRDRGVRARNFGVIMPTRHHANTAAVLLEVAFLTNPEQAERLTNDNYKNRIAGAVASAIRDALTTSTSSHSYMMSGFGNGSQASDGPIPDNIPLTPDTGGRSIGESALEIGDIIVSTTNENVSRVIRHVTGSQVSHAALYVGDGMVVESAGDGVVLTTLRQALADDSVAVALRYPGLTVSQQFMIRDFAGQHLDSGYDYVGIARHLLYRLTGAACDRFEGASRAACEAGRYQISFGNDDSDRWYCSELVFAAYQHAGVSLATVPHTSTPQTLVELTTTLEYVGHLKSYPGEHGGLEATSKALAHAYPSVKQQQAEAVIAGLALGVNAIVAVSGNTRDISWNLERLDGSYHPYHETSTREEKISNGRGRYSMYRSRAYAYIENGFTDEISAKINFSWEGNGTYIQNVFVNDPTDINDAAGWSLHVTSKVRRNSNVYTRGGQNRIARVDLVFSWHFSNFLGGGTTCVETFRLYADGHMEYRRVWDDNESQRTINQMQDASSNETRSSSLAAENDYSDREIQENRIAARGPEATDDEWTQIEREPVAAAMPPRLPTDEQPARVASYRRPRSLQTDFGMCSNPSVTPMSAYRKRREHFGGIPIHSSRVFTNTAEDILGETQMPPVISAQLAPEPSPHSETDAESIEQQQVLEETREYEDPSNFPVNLPEPGRGEDSFNVTIPEGMQFAHVDVEFLELSTMAKAEVTHMPQRGATGSGRIVVQWSHPPYGNVRYRVRAYVSLDGSSRTVRVLNESPGYDLRTKALIRQDVPVEYIVSGNKAKLLNDAIQKLKREQGQAPAPAQSQAVITTAVVIALIIAAVVVVGMIVLYVILHEAMERGYDIEDTKYKAEVGSGETRQEHELAFNLTKPRT
ncbi:MAG: N-acetylmuramoyl-L-alanine amidase, partial [Gammaproteobacteria bacterium]|nr:N-acetylmuramoyl-L-alanine amidase [Gammaproteobacteria bacterium]